MYITVKEATEITGLSKVSIYTYIRQGIIRTDPKSKNTMVSIEDIYKIRGERCKNGR
jgi:predicted DNA-binding transcriptional regulator AlpA